MKSWLISYSEESKIIGIADGNAEIVNHFKLISDKTKNHMGIRSERFAMVIKNNTVLKLQIERYGAINGFDYLPKLASKYEFKIQLSYAI